MLFIVLSKHEIHKKLLPEVMCYTCPWTGLVYYTWYMFSLHLRLFIITKTFLLSSLTCLTGCKEKT
jgi:hypothetical protein